MKKYNPLYYLLFILLVTGAFASMAQNSYGLKIMGGVAFSFGILFLIQLLSGSRQKNKPDAMSTAELAGLFLLSVILGFRIFYIHFSFIELIFTTAGVLLILIYISKMVNRFSQLKSQSRLLAILISDFHLSLILFLLSLVLVPYVSTIASIIGIVAFVLLLVFIATGFLRKEYLVNGENVSAFLVVRRFKDHSIVLISLFSLFSLYVGFNKIGVVPGIYSDEFPQAYYELVDKATSGKDKPVDGKYRYEEFMEKYKQFLKVNVSSK